MSRSSVRIWSTVWRQLRSLCGTGIAEARHRDLATIMADAVASKQIPSGRLDFKDNRTWILITACRVGTDDAVTVGMTLDQWLELPTVQYVIKLELSRQQPRRPIETAGDPVASPPVPRGQMEWKEGQNWIVLTAYRTETKEPVTLEFTLWQWLELIPVRYAVEERLERWQGNKARQLGDTL